MSSGVQPARYVYSIYGVHVTSDIPLGFPVGRGAETDRARVTVAFVCGDGHAAWPTGPAEPRDEFVFVEQSGGTLYLRWPGLYEFTVAADGTRVAYRALDGCDRSVFQHFLFGQVLAVAIVRQGIEPLHASVVEVGDGAIGFLGDCTFGKSTLLASFLQAGHRVLTDDMLIVERRSGVPHALPGSGRIKLLPDSARLFLDGAGGTPLNPMTAKRSFALDGSRCADSSRPLRMLFLLPEPDERDAADAIDIQPVSRAEMVRELVKNTFTVHLVDRDRLARQFDAATRLASGVDGFRLRYPTGLHHVPAVRQAIVAHAQAWVVQCA